MGPHGAWIEVGPAGAQSCLVLYPRSMMADSAERKPSIVFTCDDIEQIYQELAARGVPLLAAAPAHGLGHVRHLQRPRRQLVRPAPGRAQLTSRGPAAERERRHGDSRPAESLRQPAGQPEHRRRRQEDGRNAEGQRRCSRGPGRHRCPPSSPSSAGRTPRRAGRWRHVDQQRLDRRAGPALGQPERRPQYQQLPDRSRDCMQPGRPPPAAGSRSAPRAPNQRLSRPIVSALTVEAIPAAASTIPTVVAMPSWESTSFGRRAAGTAAAPSARIVSAIRRPRRSRRGETASGWPPVSAGPVASARRAGRARHEQRDQQAGGEQHDAGAGERRPQPELVGERAAEQRAERDPEYFADWSMPEHSPRCWRGVVSEASVAMAVTTPVKNAVDDAQHQQAARASGRTRSAGSPIPAPNDARWIISRARSGPPPCPRSAPCRPSRRRRGRRSARPRGRPRPGR